MELGLKVPLTSDSPSRPADGSVGDWGRRAEDLGYSSIWLSEGWGGSAFVELAEAAVRTEEVQLCTAIVNVYSRTPAVLAMGAASLARISDGRLTLGVGSSHSGIVEGLHSIPFERPVRRGHEAIELVKALTGSAETVDYDGQIFDVEGYPGFDTSVPVYNAALGEANRRATGRVADGWIPFLLPVSGMDDLFETVAAAAREAGRDPDDVTVTPQVLAAVTDDPADGRRAVRDFLAPYLGWENYRNGLREWYPDEMDGFQNAWEAGDEEAARAEITDEIVDDLAITGTPETARDRLRAMGNDSVIDTPIVYVPTGASADVRDRTIEALAPSNL